MIFSPRGRVGAKVGSTRCGQDESIGDFTCKAAVFRGGTVINKVLIMYRMQVLATIFTLVFTMQMDGQLSNLAGSVFRLLLERLS